MEDANNTCDKKIAHNTENIEYTEKYGKLQEIMEKYGKLQENIENTENMENTLSKPLGVDCQYCDKNQNNCEWVCEYCGKNQYDCVCCDCGEIDCDECAKPLWVTVCCDKNENDCECDKCPTCSESE